MPGRTAVKARTACVVHIWWCSGAQSEGSIWLLVGKETDRYPLETGRADRGTAGAHQPPHSS